MYKVAVIENESELLRSGYANIVPKLRRLVRPERYTIDSFSVANIESLFETGVNALEVYDSLFITTNATSDRVVLGVLRKHLQRIAAFLDSGKGLFVSSQKKLST